MNTYSHKSIYSFISLCLLGTFLSSCVDLSGTTSAEKKEKVLASHHSNKTSKTKNVIKSKGEVHTMRGGLGIFSIGMNQLKDAVAEKYNVPSSSSMWYNAGHVSQSIIRYYYKHPSHRPIILIGHSLGANEQIKVARNLDKAGIPVALLVTVDAVSVTRVPGNVQEVLNIYKPGFVPMFSGLKLKADNPNTTHVDNVNVNDLKGIDVNHFTIDKHKTLQDMIMVKVEKALSNGNRKQA